MKESHFCPKCDHNEILHIGNVADLEDDQQTPQGAALALRSVPNPYRPQNVSEGFLQAYVCRSCGFVEYYVQDPLSITVDNKYVRLLIGRKRLP